MPIEVPETEVLQTVAAFKDLYNVAQSGLSMDDALEEEFAREYPDIKDTNDRLAGFKKD